MDTNWHKKLSNADNYPNSAYSQYVSYRYCKGLDSRGSLSAESENAAPKL